MADSVPEDWKPEPWVAVFSKRELQWLATRLDAANRQVRIVNRRLTEQLRQAEQ